MSTVDLDVEALGRDLCNWNTWGNDDELGTLNYIDEGTTRAAAKLVVSGRIHPLGVTLDRSGPAISSPRRFNPLHYMTALPTEGLRPGEVGVADDVVVMPLQCGTQWDALSHVAHRGLLYGGRPASLVTSAGALTNDARNLSARMASRGVLADVARMRGVPNLEPGVAIEADDLEAVLESEGVRVGAGDVLLVRTGFLESCRERQWHGFSDQAPGLGMSVLRWLHERRVAAVATDTYAVEVKPYQVVGQAIPFHVVALVYMGLVLGEIFDLAELSSDCFEDGVYDFFFVAQGLPVTGGVGTPVNPYAIK